MVRKVGAVLAGAAVVVVVITMIQFLGAQLHPLPEGVDPMDPSDADAFAAYLAELPASGWILGFGSELVGAFLGALTAGWIARDHRSWFAGGIVALALGGSVLNWTSFPHPTWFIVGQLVAYPLVFLLAVRTLGRSSWEG